MQFCSGRLDKNSASDAGVAGDVISEYFNMHCSDEVGTVLPVLIKVYLSFALVLVFVEIYGLIGLFFSLSVYPTGT